MADVLTCSIGLNMFCSRGPREGCALRDLGMFAETTVSFFM